MNVKVLLPCSISLLIAGYFLGAFLMSEYNRAANIKRVEHDISAFYSERKEEIIVKIHRQYSKEGLGSYESAERW